MLSHTGRIILHLAVSNSSCNQLIHAPICPRVAKRAGRCGQLAANARRSRVCLKNSSVVGAAFRRPYSCCEIPFALLNPRAREFTTRPHSKDHAWEPGTRGRKHCLGVFTPVLAKQSMSWNLLDSISVGVVGTRLPTVCAVPPGA